MREVLLGVSVVAQAPGEGHLGSCTSCGHGLIRALAPESAVKDAVVQGLPGARQRSRDDGQVDVGGSDDYDVRLPIVGLSDAEDPLRDQLQDAVGIDFDRDVHERRADSLVGLAV